MTAGLLVRALLMGLRRGLIEKKAIIHTDRGNQYVSSIYRELLNRHALRQSMSGKGNCYDTRSSGKFLWRLQNRISLRWII